MNIHKALAIATVVVSTFSCAPVHAGSECATTDNPCSVRAYSETYHHGRRTGTDTAKLFDRNIRAVFVPVWPDLGGVVKKGDLVDVIVTLDGERIGSSNGVTKTIIQAAEVYAVVHDKIAGSSSMALLLTLEQAELLTHAQSIGSISYTLYVDGSDLVRTAGVTTSSFMDKYGFYYTAH